MIRLIFLFVFLNYSTFAQTDQYMFSKEIVNEIITNTNINSDQNDIHYYLQEGAWKFSFIGEYKSALKYWDAHRQETSQIYKEDSIYFMSLNAYPAKDFIINKAKNEQIIILNESHHMPLHRVFATSLLEDLYSLGFKYLGVEAYDYKDSLLRARGFPVMETGYYIKEAQFGNLIRKALELGFNIFPYEADTNAFGKEREIQQAKNIQKVLDQDPSAKILIYAGYDHIREDSLFNSWEKAMAGRLKEYTGIDPFTINQEKMSEASHPNFENAFYRLSKENKAVIYIDSEGKPFAESRTSNQYDVSVFHPRTIYIQGRPDWLLRDDRKFYTIPQNNIEFDCPCLVFAYKANEYENAIPIDLIELGAKNEQRALILPIGIFKILIINKQRQMIEFNIDFR